MSLYATTKEFLLPVYSCDHFTVYLEVRKCLEMFSDSYSCVLVRTILRIFIIIKHRQCVERDVKI